MTRTGKTSSKLTLPFLLLLTGLASAATGSAHAGKTNACANDCTWMAAQVAGCSGMDIRCACTTALFRNAFRQCVERSCSFTDAGEGVRFFEDVCAPHSSVGDEVILQGPDYYGPEAVENVRHGHAHHGYHAHMHHARAEKAENAIPTLPSPIPTPGPSAAPSAPVNVESSAPVGGTSSAATSEATTASESSSSASAGHISASHSSSPTHTGTSSQAAGTTTSKPAPPHPSGTTTAPTTPVTTPTTPTPSPSQETSQSESNTQPTPSSASAPASSGSGTTLVVSATNVSAGSPGTDVSINPSIVTPTLPSGHFDPAPSSSGARAGAHAGGFVVTLGVVVVAVLGGGAFVL